MTSGFNNFNYFAVINSRYKYSVQIYRTVTIQDFVAKIHGHLFKGLPQTVVSNSKWEVGIHTNTPS